MENYKVRKYFLIIGLAVVLVTMTVVPIIADNNTSKEPKTPPRTKIHGNSNVAHVLLINKDSGWNSIWPGTFGTLKYNREGEQFTYHFNGHKLKPKTEYSLIYYADPWPGENSILIDSGKTNNGGNLHLKGSIDLGTNLPNCEDENYPVGAKIWLVLSNDIVVDVDRHIIDWNDWTPVEYLFEYDLITYYDTDAAVPCDPITTTESD